MTVSLIKSKRIAKAAINSDESNEIDSTEEISSEPTSDSEMNPEA